MQSFALNRKGYRDFEILEKYESGIKLYGHEVKSIKEGKADLKGAYVKFIKGYPVLIGLKVPLYTKATNIIVHDPARTKEILLNRSEIKSLLGKVEQKGFALIPLKIYSKGRLLKLLIGLARGKAKANKKQELIKKQQDLEVRKILKNQRS